MTSADSYSKVVAFISVARAAFGKVRSHGTAAAAIFLMQ